MTQTAVAEIASSGIDLFLVAGEESGDQLGAALMRALRVRTGGRVRFTGVGGREMTREGIASLYSIDDLPIIGFTAIPRRLPRILRLMRFTAKQVVAKRPHGLVIIDSPAFTRGIARRVRAGDPTIPIIEYVSPQVWAWRPGRARVMRAYIDRILAILPFEPEVHRRLGGPPCTYVGHPLAATIHHLRPDAEEARRRLASPPILLMLPGSRIGEIKRLFTVFTEAMAKVRDRVGPLEVVIPTVPHLVDPIRRASASWRVPPRIVAEPADKAAAFRIARAALAKSGTVTLELALAGVPMVTAYRISAIEYLAVHRAIAKRLSSVILANIVLGEDVVPELLQRDCTADKLSDALAPLLGETAQRRRQLEAFARLDAIMEIGTSSPAARAADVVLEVLRAGEPRTGAPAVEDSMHSSIKIE
jgi:lipid-A-disaccharide synthase